MYELTKEIAQAIMQGQTEFEGVKLPSPQTAGTYFQRLTYAQDKAEKIAEQIRK